MAEKKDLVDFVISDHREVEAVFSEIESTSSPDLRRQLVDHAISLLTVHSVGEEQYLYPAARGAVPKGEQIVAKELEEHQEAEQVMKDLEGMDSSSPEFDEKLSTLVSDIRHHLEEEEGDLLPKLREHCSKEQLQDLGENFRQAKESAPIRPHPSASKKPPASKVVDPGAGLVDRLRTALGSDH